MENTITKAQAADLAVTYKAFCVANSEDNRRSRRVWARLLNASQVEIGIELVKPEYLEAFMED